MDLKELRNKAGQLFKEMRSMQDTADEEKRGFTAEEKEKYSSIEINYDETRSEISRLERLQEHERTNAAKVIIEEDVRSGKDVDIMEEYRVAYFDVLGKAATGPVSNEDRSKLDSLQSQLISSHPEIRTYQVDKDTYGGYLVPVQFRDDLIKTVDNMVFIRQKATVLPVNGRVEVEIPRKTTRADGAAWTGEISSVTEDTNLTFGLSRMKPNTLTSLIKVSRALLKSGAMSVDSIIRDEFAYDFGITQEEAFMTGSGANQPLGLFTANANGISTDRDMSTDNTATAITMDNLYNNIYNVKPQHRMNGEFAFSRTAVRNVRKLKDGEGNYLWQPSNQAGQPDRLLGYPVFESEYVPSTFTTGLYVGMFGDFSKYYIVEDTQLEIQVLQEYYAVNNQVGYIGRAGVDGAPVLEEAFSRIKLG